MAILNPRVYVIGLDSRHDRMQEFCRDLPPDWPFTLPVRLSAVNGKAVRPPGWWKAGGPAWGCMMSHARIMEDCLGDSIQTVLILEDDAVFCEGFSKKVQEFLRIVPAGWDQLYLGGQHLKNPIPSSGGYYTCVNVNRCHGYMMSLDFMRFVYPLLFEPVRWEADYPMHIDHFFGRLHETRVHQVLAPMQWLIGQREGRSDICGQDMQRRFWQQV